MSRPAPEAHRRRQAGQPLPHSYLVYNTEFPGNPQCTPSASYQSAKLKQLDANAGLNQEERAAAKAEVVEKACICWELSGSALKQVAPKCAPPRPSAPAPTWPGSTAK